MYFYNSKKIVSKPLFDNICDETVFSKVFKTWAKDLQQFLHYKYGNQLNVEDKVQEAFAKLWENCSTTSPDKAKSFLFTVANNLCLNELKHQKVVIKHQKENPLKVASHETPQFTLEEKEYLQKFEYALSQLTEAQRVAFMMNRAEGKRHKEIAELLGISRKAVEKRIYGALSKMREYLEEI